MSTHLRRLSTISSHLHPAATKPPLKMSSPPSPPPAPWKDPFSSHLSHLTPPIFTLATLHPVPQHLSPSISIPVLPRARTCVFRGFFASLPSNPHNPAPLNPPTFTSDLLTFTTDARMSKTAEIFDTAGGTSQTASGGPSGGGGPVEAVFWVDETKTQWRVRGTAWVLGPDVDSDSDGAMKVREVLRQRMRKLEEKGGEEWEFGREVTAHFGNLSPVMRGSFRGPESGAPVDYHQKAKLGERVEDLGDVVARGNFRVVVIVPEEVDRVDLREEVRPRRWLYTYRGEQQQRQQGEEGDGQGAKLAGGKLEGEWEVVELWP
ncbi:pyridoxamine 5'-phosphate oxidase-domain-containing protein [Triangularia verruculosa]|uniref:Pyridoxamine 5'-phosphate oxidase-domain-containing protein n=1 Tax=Triangularia verruculosa TaxID=2587418 RepID=A0AAN6XNS0_9PEZI|nr:pyridoxamine 5'-phosphate oxidase-domain-containing protein [Triangularia verruculosa]